MEKKMKRNFFVRAIWDDEANVYYSESDIFGLHIETKTLDEFEEVLNDMALELIMDNHLDTHDLVSIPMRDWVPTIIWQRPNERAVAA
jgi:Fic family protein